MQELITYFLPPSTVLQIARAKAEALSLLPGIWERDYRRERE
jgi:hypothetical protein